MEESNDTKSNGIVLFVNDSLFSYLYLRRAIKEFESDVVLVVLSKKNSGSLSSIGDIYKKTHLSYFWYRAIVQLISAVLSRIGYSCEAVVKKNSNIEMVRSKRINDEFDSFVGSSTFRLGLTANFDQIIGPKVLKQFTHGIYNFHASKLPEDKGISPVLWCFARGDSQIWSSIYQVDEGLDSGPLYAQYETPVPDDITAFSLYLNVCDKAGIKILELVRKIHSHKEIPLVIQPSIDPIKPFSWPDQQFGSMLKENQKTLIKMRDLMTLLRGLFTNRYR